MEWKVKAELSPRHHIEQNAFKVFRLGQRGKHWVVKGLFKMAEPACRAARVDQCIGNRLRECFFADVMGTGKRREQSIFREQLEGTDVQLAIPA